MSDLTRVTADAETLMKQAGMTARVYLAKAVTAIDEEFGEGYAKSNPELVGAFIQSCALDYQAAAIQIAGQRIESGLSEIDYTISNKA